METRTQLKSVIFTTDIFAVNVRTRQSTLKTTEDHVIDKSVPIEKVPKWFQGVQLNYAENILRYTANISVVKITLFNCVRVSTVISL